MSRSGTAGELGAGAAEGAIIGAFFAVVPVPIAPLAALGLIVALPIALFLEARGSWRRWSSRDRLRAVARPLGRVAACVVLPGVAAALPLKPLDRRVAIEAEVAVEDAVAALARVWIQRGARGAEPGAPGSP